MAKLVTLETAWSTRPQPRRRPAWSGSRDSRPGRDLLSTFAPPGPSASAAGSALGVLWRGLPWDGGLCPGWPSGSLPLAASTITTSRGPCGPGTGRERCLRAAPGARHGELPVGLPPQHLVEQPGLQQLGYPAKPDVPRRHEVVVGQAMPGEGADQLADPVPGAPAQPQLREHLGQLGEVHAVVAQVRPGALGEGQP